MPTRIQSQSPSWKNQRSAPPIASPAATCSQKPYGRASPKSTPTAAASSASPTSSATTADQSPPFETRSVTKSHVPAAATSTSSGNSNTRSAASAATTTSSSSTST